MTIYIKIMHNYFSRTGFSAIDPSSFSLHLELNETRRGTTTRLIQNQDSYRTAELFENL